MRKLVILAVIMAAMLTGCSKGESAKATEKPNDSEKIVIVPQSETISDPEDTAHIEPELEIADKDTGTSESEAMENISVPSATASSKEDFYEESGVFDMDAYAKSLGYKQIEDPYHNGAFYMLDKENTHIYFYKVTDMASTGFNRDGVHLRFLVNDNMGESDPKATVTFAGITDEESTLLLDDECTLLQIYATTPIAKIDFYTLPLTVGRTLSYMNKEEEYTEDGFILDHCGDTDIDKSFIKARGE